jgi:hypothetical protein
MVRSGDAWHDLTMKKKAAPKRPRDINQRAKSVVDQATANKPKPKSK